MMTDAGHPADPQGVLNAYFRQQAPYWADIYDSSGIKESIHQERLRAALVMVDTIGLPRQARILDVGSGAGLASVAMAGRGFLVDAVDPCHAMVEATRGRAAEAGVQSRIITATGDVHALPFPDQSFSLVVALGVLPWLPEIGKPIREIARVLRPGGHVIVSVDSLWQVRQALDPLRSPLLWWPKRIVRRLLQLKYTAGGLARPTSIRAFRRALRGADFNELRGTAIGFGPLTFFDQEILPRSAGLCPASAPLGPNGMIE